MPTIIRKYVLQWNPVRLIAWVAVQNGGDATTTQIIRRQRRQHYPSACEQDNLGSEFIAANFQTNFPIRPFGMRWNTICRVR
jgi:hypothetical protein